MVGLCVLKVFDEYLVIINVIENYDGELVEMFMKCYISVF